MPVLWIITLAITLNQGERSFSTLCHTAKLTRALMESFFLIPDSFVSSPTPPPTATPRSLCRVRAPVRFCGCLSVSVRARLCPRVWRCVCIRVLRYIHSCRKEAASPGGVLGSFVPSSDAFVLICHTVLRGGAQYLHATLL